MNPDTKHMFSSLVNSHSPHQQTAVLACFSLIPDSTAPAAALSAELSLCLQCNVPTYNLQCRFPQPAPQVSTACSAGCHSLHHQIPQPATPFCNYLSPMDGRRLLQPAVQVRIACGVSSQSLQHWFPQPAVQVRTFCQRRFPSLQRGRRLSLPL